jgi:hypothetical protein
MTSTQKVLPFETYPHQGRQLLGKRASGNCRHIYGLQLQILTGGTHCVYCDVSLIDTYEHWLNMQVDHVVPSTSGKKCGIPEEWLLDYSNTVLCCGACNGFKNRYEVTVCPTSLAEFYDLRNRIFIDRKLGILQSHEELSSKVGDERIKQVAYS